MKRFYSIFIFFLWGVLLLVYPLQIYAQAKCNVDRDTVKLLLYYPSQMGTGFINFDNKEGKSMLDYRLSINYKRMENSVLIPDSPVDSSENMEFSRVLQYENETGLSYDYGFDDGRETVLAIRYNAGAEGMNISGVGTWFIGENTTQGIIHAEIRAGGSSVADAFILATGTFNYTIGSGEENGKMYNIPLEKEAVIYPNEDFYVVFTYPASRIRPQGCVKNEKIEKAEGRYLIHDNGVWKDIQEEDQNTDCAFISYVAEKAPKNIGWLKILSSQSGTVPAGGNSQVKLQYNASVAVLGNQYADLLFHTNDSLHPIINIPVVLRMNEAPYFYNAPTEIYVVENTITAFNINIVDLESDTFKVANLQGCKIASYKISEGNLTLTVAPHPGDAGTYNIKYRATDAYGASRDLSVTIYVNSPPVYTGGDSVFICSIRQKMIEYNIKDLFADPEGDNFAFTVSSANPFIADILQVNDSILAVYPKETGQTVFNFTVTDSHGAKANYSIPVSVGLCINTSGIIVQKWNNTLLVNNYGNKYKSDGYQWYKNNEPIHGAIRQYYSAGNRDADLLDFSAEYYIRLVTENNDTLYTCPMIPQKTDNSLKAYPNPVLRGGNLTIEANRPDMENSPVTVHILNLSGQVIKTLSVAGKFVSIPMPSTQGLYIVKVSAGSEGKAFNISVE